ncbi:MAG: YkgJ family cysteine cluster protein, partial [Desulfosarcina sp.]
MCRNDANQCRRCGVCCEKGGPSLHHEDRHLVDSGRIPARCLFTLRQGELARDNVKGVLAPLSAEIIKIKGQSGSWTCMFYDDETRGCGIYDHRPLECRALNCRDTRRIAKVYA